MKFYKRDPDRALAGMAEMNFEQRGAYNSLLDLLYSRDGDVPDDDARVSRMLSCHWRQWARLKAELIALGKVWVEGGKLHARRVQETLKEAADFSQEQRRKVAKRWEKSEKDNENKEADIPPGNTLTPTATPRVSVSNDTDFKSPDEPAPRQKRKEDRGTRIPDDFWPDATSQAKARRIGIDLTIEHIGSFLDYWRSVPGAKGRKLDWQATYRNHLDFLANRKPHERPKPTQSTIADGFAKVRAVIDEVASRAAEDGGTGGPENLVVLSGLRQGTG